MDSSRCEFLIEASPQSTDVEQTKETCAVCFPVGFFPHILCNSSCPFLFALSSSRQLSFFVLFTDSFPVITLNLQVRGAFFPHEVAPAVVRLRCYRLSFAVSQWNVVAVLVGSCTEHAAQHSAALTS